MAEKLTEDQQKRIAATLRRIRAGLSRATGGQFSEPAHLFKPVVHHDTSK
ncbi:hypothetical protein [Octadecabacter antarcticus]|nr:hypothetical protein [Octadecabacter antarcticus]